MKNRIASSLLCLIFAATAWSQAPTVINATDLLVNSRTTLNTNFLNLYNGSSGLIDCSATPGAFVVTLNGAGSAPVCRTLTWTIISTLTGFPSSFVNSWNSRTGAVTLQSSDVAAVEQDLRNSASPNFNSLSLGGTLAVTGASTFTGLATFNGGISGSISGGTYTGTPVGPTYGGTGVNNGSATLTLGGNTAFSGAYTFAGTLTANTAVTFPTSGTLSALAMADCGTSASCASPTTIAAPLAVVGHTAFSASTTLTITGLPFTATTTFNCSASDPTHGYTVLIANQSASSFEITAGTSNSDTWEWSCLGH